MPIKVPTSRKLNTATAQAQAKARMASFPQYLLVCALFVAVFVCQACKLMIVIFFLSFSINNFLFVFVAKILNANLYTKTAEYLS
mgnify:FL=1